MRRCSWGGSHRAALTLTCLAAILQIGRVSTAADFINNFAPLIAGSGALIAIVAAAFYRGPWLPAAACLLTLSAGGWIVPELLQARMPAPPQKGAMLRVVQFNVYKDNPTPERSAAWISAQHADIVVLEEATHRPDGVVARLSREFPFRVSCMRNMRCSTVILSKRKPIEAGGLARADPENRKGVSAVWARYADQSGPYLLIGVHLQRPWPLGNQDGARKLLGRVLRQTSNSRTIVAGDFNLTPWTSTMRRQDVLFSLPRITRALPTWPAPFPIFPIDHIYAGKGWKVVNLVRGPATGSDHYPLSLVLSPSRLYQWP